MKGGTTMEIKKIHQEWSEKTTDKICQKLPVSVQV